VKDAAAAAVLEHEAAHDGGLAGVTMRELRLHLRVYVLRHEVMVADCDGVFAEPFAAERNRK
jgi:hypothetical protein